MPQRIFNNIDYLPPELGVPQKKVNRIFNSFIIRSCRQGGSCIVVETNQQSYEKLIDLSEAVTQ